MKTTPTTWAITGALGYSGKYISKAALQKGIAVRALTNSPERKNPDHIPVYPLDWENPSLLEKNLEGCDTLINTYWVRFAHGTYSHESAVENTKKLFLAAKKAGVRRIVHVSITHPDKNSTLPYFRGKAELEDFLKDLGVPHTILRPAVLFGETPEESILVNNIAWTLRHLPVVGYFGKGDYRLQPIHVEDFAQLAVEQGSRTDSSNETVEAIGPETFTYLDLLKLTRLHIGKRTLLLRVPIFAGYWAAKVIGWRYHDVTLTRDEITGLMEDRLAVDGKPPAGERKLSDWIRKHARALGIHYASELRRRK